MISFLERRRNTRFHKGLSAFIAFTFIFSSVTPPASVYAQGVPTYLNLPAPGVMVSPSPGFMPAMVKGITIDPVNPLHFNFIVDTGHTSLEGEELREEANRLVKYFLASLTVPEKELWVNLSPYEKDRIIPQAFGTTEMGRDLLAQDYILKQLTASLIHPDQELGKEFWQRVKDKAYEKFGTTNIPMNTFNKVWIVPDRALVYENNGTAFVVESHLKVMLEEDYLALSHQTSDVSHQLLTTDDRRLTTEMSSIQSQILKDVVIPEIEKEVNEGKTFASLRQIYSSMILATWYKMNLKNSLLGQVYVDKNKIRGIDIEDKDAKNKIYEQYLDAFKKGVYNFIREDYDPATKDIIPRKYFSGGVDGRDMAMLVAEIEGDLGQFPEAVQQQVINASSPTGRFFDTDVDLLETIAGDSAQLAVYEASSRLADQAVITDPSTATDAERQQRLARRPEIWREEPPNADDLKELLEVAERHGITPITEGHLNTITIVRRRVHSAISQVNGRFNSVYREAQDLIDYQIYWSILDVVLGRIPTISDDYKRLKGYQDIIERVARSLASRIVVHPDFDKLPVFRREDVPANQGQIMLVKPKVQFQSSHAYIVPFIRNEALLFDDYSDKPDHIRLLTTSDAAMVAGVEDLDIREVLDQKGQAVDLSEFEGDVGSGKIINPRSQALIAHLMEKFGERQLELLKKRGERINAAERGENSYIPNMDDKVSDAYGNTLTVREILEGDWKVDEAPERLTKAGGILSGPWNLFFALSAFGSNVLDEVEKKFGISLKEKTDEEIIAIIEGNPAIAEYIEAMRPVRIFGDDEDAAGIDSDKRFAEHQIGADIINGRLKSVKHGDKNKIYRVLPRKYWPTVTKRPSGLQLWSRHESYKGMPVSMMMRDLAYYVEPNFEALEADPRQGIDIVVPKLEHWEEVKLFVETAIETKEFLGLKEEINLIFMHEVEEATLMLELMFWAGRHHIKFSNDGRWDWGASAIRLAWFLKKRVWPGLDKIGMKDKPFRPYTGLNLSASKKRGVHPEGGMWTGMTSRRYPDGAPMDPAADEIATTGFIGDKIDERKQGKLQAWAATPIAIPKENEIFRADVEEMEVAPPVYNEGLYADLLHVPEGNIARAEIYKNLYELLTYTLGYRKQGAAVAVDNLHNGGRTMFDLATAKKAQYWLWTLIKSGAKVQEGPDTGTIITWEYLSQIMDEVARNTQARYMESGFSDEDIAIAREINKSIITSKNMVLHESIVFNTTLDDRTLIDVKRKLKRFFAIHDNADNLYDRRILFAPFQLADAAMLTPEEEIRVESGVLTRAELLNLQERLQTVAAGYAPFNPQGEEASNSIIEEQLEKIANALRDGNYIDTAMAAGKSDDRAPELGPRVARRDSLTGEIVPEEPASIEHMTDMIASLRERDQKGTPKEGDAAMVAAQLEELKEMVVAFEDARIREEGVGLLEMIQTLQRAIRDSGGQNVPLTTAQEAIQTFYRILIPRSSGDVLSFRTLAAYDQDKIGPLQRKIKEVTETLERLVEKTVVSVAETDAAMAVTERYRDADIFEAMILSDYFSTRILLDRIEDYSVIEGMISLDFRAMRISNQFPKNAKRFVSQFDDLQLRDKVTRALDYLSLMEPERRRVLYRFRDRLQSEEASNSYILSKIADFDDSRRRSYYPESSILQNLDSVGFERLDKLRMDPHRIAELAYGETFDNMFRAVDAAAGDILFTQRKKMGHLGKRGGTSQEPIDAAMVGDESAQKEWFRAIDRLAQVRERIEKAKYEDGDIGDLPSLLEEERVLEETIDRTRAQWDDSIDNAMGAVRILEAVLTSEEGYRTADELRGAIAELEKRLGQIGNELVEYQDQVVIVEGLEGEKEQTELAIREIRERITSLTSAAAMAASDKDRAPELGPRFVRGDPLSGELVPEEPAASEKHMRGIIASLRERDQKGTPKEGDAAMAVDARAVAEEYFNWLLQSVAGFKAQYDRALPGGMYEAQVEADLDRAEKELAFLAALLGKEVSVDKLNRVDRKSAIEQLARLPDELAGLIKRWEKIKDKNDEEWARSRDPEERYNEVPTFGDVKGTVSSRLRDVWAMIEVGKERFTGALSPEVLARYEALVAQMNIPGPEGGMVARMGGDAAMVASLEERAQIMQERWNQQRAEGRWIKRVWSAEKVAAAQGPVLRTWSIANHMAEKFNGKLRRYFRDVKSIDTFGPSNELMAEAMAVSEILQAEPITKTKLLDVAYDYEVDALYNHLASLGFIDAETGVIQDSFSMMENVKQEYYERIDDAFKERSGIIFALLQQNLFKHIEGYYLGGWDAQMLRGKGDRARDQYDYLGILAARISKLNTWHAIYQEIARAQMTPEQRSLVRPVDFYVPIFVDFDEGHLKVQEMARRVLSMGEEETHIAAVHIEDQAHGCKMCGHMSGKVLDSTDHWIKTLLEARFEFDRMGLNTLIVARTDAESAEWITGHDDGRDQKFILGVTEADEAERLEEAVKALEKDLVAKKMPAEKIAATITRFRSDWQKYIPLIHDSKGRVQTYQDVITAANQSGLEASELQKVHNQWKIMANLLTIDEIVARTIAANQDKIGMTVEEWRAFVAAIPYERDVRFFDLVKAKAREIGIRLIDSSQIQLVDEAPEAFSGTINVLWDFQLTRSVEKRSRTIWMINSGMEMAIARSKSALPYTDISWFEQHHPHIGEVKQWSTALDAEARRLLFAEGWYDEILERFDQAFRDRIKTQVEKIIETYHNNRPVDPDSYSYALKALQELDLAHDDAVGLLDATTRIKANNTSPSFYWPLAKTEDGSRLMTPEERKAFLPEQGKYSQFNFITYGGSTFLHAATMQFLQGTDGKGGYLRDGMDGLAQWQEIGRKQKSGMSINPQVFAGNRGLEFMTSVAIGETAAISFEGGKGDTMKDRAGLKAKDDLMGEIHRQIAEKETALQHDLSVNELADLINKLRISLIGVRTRITQLRTRERSLKDGPEERSSIAQQIAQLTTDRHTIEGLLKRAISRIRPLEGADEVAFPLEDVSLDHIEERFAAPETFYPEPAQDIENELYILRAGQRAILLEIGQLSDELGSSELNEKRARINRLIGQGEQLLSGDSAMMAADRILEDLLAGRIMVKDAYDRLLSLGESSEDDVIALIVNSGLGLGLLQVMDEINRDPNPVGTVVDGEQEEVDDLDTGATQVLPPRPISEYPPEDEDHAMLTDVQKTLLRERVQSLTGRGRNYFASDGSPSTGNALLKRYGFKIVDAKAYPDADKVDGANYLLRERMRRMFYTAPGIQYVFGGIIVQDESVSYVDDEDKPLLATHVEGRGISIIHKTDRGIDDDTQSPRPSREGLDPEKLSKPKGLGIDNLRAIMDMIPTSHADKFRQTFTIDTDAGLPTQRNIEANMEMLAQHVLDVQLLGRVPTPEPEVLIKGSHDIEASAEANRRILKVYTEAASRLGVDLKGSAIKVSMVTSGDKAPKDTPEEVARATVAVHMDSLPPELGTIVFLSGGQTADQAARNLNAIVKEAKRVGAPWRYAASFSRASKETALTVLNGDFVNEQAAQNEFVRASFRIQAASLGVMDEYDALIERIGVEAFVARVDVYGRMVQVNIDNEQLGQMIRDFDAAMAAQPNKEEATRLRAIRDELPVILTTHTAAKLTALGLRGAYQKILDVVKSVSDTSEQRTQIALLFTQLHQTTQRGEFAEVAIMVLGKEGTIAKDELKRMQTAITDVVDGFAKRIFERTIKELGIIMMVRVSEGFGRDEVAESLKSNEVIMPNLIQHEVEAIKAAIDRGDEFYLSENGRYYPILDAIIDVVEGTNQFVTNSGNRSLEEAPENEAGANSDIVVGRGVRDLGNVPDGYVHQFITNVGEDADALRAAAVEVGGEKYHLYDPELYAAHPKEGILAYLKFLAAIRRQELSQVQEEIIVMNRKRETAFVRAIEEVKQEYGIQGVSVVQKTLQDGTVAHGLRATLTPALYEAATGRSYGVHKTVITVGGSAEGFMNLAIAGAAKYIGAVAGVRVYNAKMNKNAAGEELPDLSERYNFKLAEASELRVIRESYGDAGAILNGQKFFTEQDVKGDVVGIFTVIANDWVFGQTGTQATEGGQTSVVIKIYNVGNELKAEIFPVEVDHTIVSIDAAMTEQGDGAMLTPAEAWEIAEDLLEEMGDEELFGDRVGLLARLIHYLDGKELSTPLSEDAPDLYSKGDLTRATHINSARDFKVREIKFRRIIREFLEGQLIVNFPSEEEDVSSSAGIDRAVTAQETTPVGGIDLNPALLNLQIKRDGRGIPLPVEMQPLQNIHIDGFIPVIINIAPINNMPMLLGIADFIPDEPIEQAQDEEEKAPALSMRKFTLRDVLDRIAIFKG